MPQGNRGHIGIRKETTTLGWGVRDGTGNNNVFLPFVSETLTANIEEVLSAIQRGERDEPKSYHGQRDFAGDVVVEVHPHSFGHILRSAINKPNPSGEFASSKITVIADCETKWEHDDAVITSLDPNEKRKGKNSCKIQVSEGALAVPTVLASQEFADSLLTTSHYKFWLRCSIPLAENDVKFRVSDQPLGADTGAEDTVTIPEMPTAYKWYEHRIAKGDVGDLGAAISCALVQFVDKGEMTLWIDDVRIVETGAPAATSAIEHVFTPIKTRTEEFHPDCPLRPYTLEVYKDDGGDAFQFLGAVVNKLSLSFSTTDKILKATLGIIAKDLGKITPTLPGLEPTNPFLWSDARIFMANKDAVVDIEEVTNRCNDLESFKVDFDNNCIAKFALNNTAIARKFIFNGYVAIPVNFVVDFISRTEFDHFIDGTERQFIIVLDGDVIKPDNGELTFKFRLRIDLPLVRYTAYPINTGGPGRLSAAVVGKAKYSSHDDWLYSIRYTIWNKQQATEYA
ncbi:hypothetical protein ES704_01028 [subsurface metagenome]|jgi:hypothetical protein